MSRFWAGVLCGGLSGLVTWLLTHNADYTAVAGLVAAVLVWLFGGLVLAVVDD